VVAPRIEPETSGSVAKNSDLYTTEAFHNFTYQFNVRVRIENPWLTARMWPVTWWIKTRISRTNKSVWSGKLLLDLASSSRFRVPWYWWPYFTVLRIQESYNWLAYTYFTTTWTTLKTPRPQVFFVVACGFFGTGKILPSRCLTTLEVTRIQSF
jgi:hypothetical protein